MKSGRCLRIGVSLAVLIATRSCPRDETVQFSRFAYLSSHCSDGWICVVSKRLLNGSRLLLRMLCNLSFCIRLGLDFVLTIIHYSN